MAGLGAYGLNISFEFYNSEILKHNMQVQLQGPIGVQPEGNGNMVLDAYISSPPIGRR